MKISKIVAAATSVLFSSSLFAYGSGYSSYPMMMDKKLISTEITGITSNGGGIGLQARYTQKFTKNITADAGLGISGGERSNRLFVGGELEMFPDYGKQPRISVRGNFEFAKEYEVRRSVLSVAPTVSKGFSFWGEEAFPFFSLPLGLSLDSETSTYQSVISANLGITGNLPIENYRHLTASIEGIIGLKDHFSGVFMGLSYPIN